MPIRANVTVNPVLSGIAHEFVSNASGYVAAALFPTFMTAEQSSDYYKFNAENLLNIPENIRRGPSGNYKRVTMKLSDDTYACKEYGLEHPIDDRERKKYANVFDADTAAINSLVTKLLLAREQRVKALATGASVPTSSPTKKWNEPDADIFGDIDLVKDTIEKNCGLLPNVMTINRGVFNVLKNHPVILDRVKWTSSQSVTAEMLASLLGIDRILVIGTVYNAAAEGQTVNPAYLWNDSVIIAHTENGQNLQAPSFGRTFAWTGETGQNGILVEMYRDDAIRSDVHRVRQDLDEKLCGPALGYHLSDVLA